MAVFKCKMCGGTLEIKDGESIALCEYCGTKQTIPTAKDEALQGLFNRANILRMKSEFDKSEQLYEKIIQADQRQAEAYWGLILCKYGIEYVEDPKTFKRIPTCHRASFESIISDDDYKSALEYADYSQRAIYEEEAKEIDRLQKEILEISKKEAQYDVFICYKETDDTGTRTQDSVIANDIYYQLTQEGLKVFYAAITLEDKLGSAYEPCIFAALNSAKVMLAIGTKHEYFNAVWVKNEWSRFLKLMKNDRSKMLIPCYRDMDAYELPEEFAHLQAQDMGKIGFINDIVRGIQKVIITNEPKETTKEVIAVNAGSTNIESLLKRAFMYIEDGNWTDADIYCEKVLDIEPENYKAYLGKLFATYHCKNTIELKNIQDSFENNKTYEKIIRFGTEELIDELKGCIVFINEKNEEERKSKLYSEGIQRIENSSSEKNYRIASQLFDSISDYKDSKIKYEYCIEKLDELQNIKAKNKKQLIKLRNVSIISITIIAVLLIVWNILNMAIFQPKNYSKGLEYLSQKDYMNAIISFNHAGNYQDSKEQLRKIYTSDFIGHKSFSSSPELILCLKGDGTVVDMPSLHSVLGEYDNKDWKNIVSIATGDSQGVASHIVGLKDNGTVVATGDNECGQCNVKRWENIISIAAGVDHTIGVKADGSVVSTGVVLIDKNELNKLRDSVDISTRWRHAAGLKSDGTVVAVGDNNRGQCNVDGWENITDVEVGFDYTVGLKSDGTVVAVGNNEHGQCNVDGWENIVSIAIGSAHGHDWNHTVGLKKDGTVVAVGDNNRGQCNVSDWKNIIAIAASSNYTLGLKSDGTLIMAGYDEPTNIIAEGWSILK